MSQGMQDDVNLPVLQPLLTEAVAAAEHSFGPHKLGCSAPL
jgi:hypothetical protein